VEGILNKPKSLYAIAHINGDHTVGIWDEHYEFDLGDQSLDAYDEQREEVREKVKELVEILTGEVTPIVFSDEINPEPEPNE
jgi:hypothetical protein